MLHVRSATIEDADGIAAVHVASWHAFYRGLLPPEAIAGRSLELRRKQWAASLQSPARVTLVACDDANAIAGFSSALLLEQPDGGFASYLQTLYLMPEAARRGTGRRLLEAIAAELLARGIPNMALRVLRLNAARGFYERLGARLVPEGIATDAGNFDDVVYAFDDLRVLSGAS